MSDYTAECDRCRQRLHMWLKRSSGSMRSHKSATTSVKSFSAWWRKRKMSSQWMWQRNAFLLPRPVPTTWCNTWKLRFWAAILVHVAGMARFAPCGHFSDRKKRKGILDWELECCAEINIVKNSPREQISSRDEFFEIFLCFPDAWPRQHRSSISMNKMALMWAKSSLAKTPRRWTGTPRWGREGEHQLFTPAEEPAGQVRCWKWTWWMTRFTTSASCSSKSSRSLMRPTWRHARSHGRWLRCHLSHLPWLIPLFIQKKGTLFSSVPFFWMKSELTSNYFGEVF